MVVVEDPIQFIQRSEITSCQLLPRGSNYTFLVTLSLSNGQHHAIYKPKSGEAPLRDFPDGTLYLREYAAYLVSEALGWSLIPTTVIRDGPHGIGIVQQYVEAEPGENYFTFKDHRAYDAQRIAVFDIMTNNADRKAGHCLKGIDGRIWSIDHGLTFHTEHKLRTVIWDFSGHPIPDGIVEDISSLQERLSTSQDPLINSLLELITPLELEMLNRRLGWLLDAKTFPHQPPGRRNTPWPPV